MNVKEFRKEIELLKQFKEFREQLKQLRELREWRRMNRKTIKFRILENLDKKELRKLLDKRLVMRKSDGISYKLKGNILTVNFPECQSYRIYHFFFIDQAIKVEVVK